MLLRDRRTIIFSVVLPIVLLPLIILLTRAVETSREERLEATGFSYAVSGTRADWARGVVRDAVALGQEEAEAERGNFEEQQTEDADSALAAGELHLVVEGMTAAEYRAEREQRTSGERPAIGETASDTAAATDESVAPTPTTPLALDVPVIRIRYRSDRESSVLARSRLRDRLEQLKSRRRADLLRDRRFEIDPDQIATLELENVASAEKEGGALLGLLLTPMLLLLMLTGGSVVAADAIAGEKERGTLETLLTTAASRDEIVWAKQLAIIAVGVTIALINVLNLLVYLEIGLFELPEQVAVSVSPVTLVLLLLLFLPLTALVSSALLLVSGYTKSYREYQINFFPVLLLFMVPSLAAALPGIDLRSAVAFVPLANVSVAVREVMVGEYDWIFLAVTMLTTGGAAAWAARLTSRALSTERLITAADLEKAELSGGPDLFPRRVLRWFGLLWVVLFISSLWFGGDLGIRGQVALNLVGIFLGGALLMIWRYRLDPRQALALRAPRAPVWIAVLIGAPSALLAGVGVARLAGLIFPVPDRMVQAFAQYLIPEGLPLWQVVLFLAVLPGICEEIAFRGVLVYGLRQKFGPVVLALVAGAIFGLFHVSLFRILPTGYLGVVLTAVVLLTGSIFPAMLWHALNNAIGIVPAYLGLWQGEPPLWTAGLGAVGLLLSFAILWRYRTPYPGLQKPSRAARQAERDRPDL